MKINSILETEVLIVGGGPSGIMSALAAAREGHNVTLIERYGFLGGCATISLVVPLMTFHAGDKQIVQGYAEELIQRIKEQGGSIGHILDPIGFAGSVTPVETEVYKYVAQEMLLEAGVQIYYHTELLGVERVDNDISKVMVHMRSGNYEIVAQRYIDASGDGDMTYLAGEEMNVGRISDGKVQPMTMMFKVGNVDIDKLIDYVDKYPQEFVLSETLTSMKDATRIAIAGFFSIVAQAQQNGDLTLNRDRVLAFELNQRGEMAVNMSRIINRIATREFDLSEATIEGRRQVFQIMRFFSKYIPGFENARLLESANQVGVRETRRLNGLYVLNELDVVEGRRFTDGVAQGSWPIDIHDPEGKQLIVVEMKWGTYYDIPYRCMLPKTINNLIVTGRLISSTHEAFASSRVSPTCMALGQAAGIAASLSLKTDKIFRDVDVSVLRERLIKTKQHLD